MGGAEKRAVQPLHAFWVSLGRGREDQPLATGRESSATQLDHDPT
jgi:hypothetical protein